MTLAEAPKHSIFAGGIESTARAGRGPPGTNNLAAIRAALEAAGVEFTNGDQPGVRLRKPPVSEIARSSIFGAPSLNS